MLFADDELWRDLTAACDPACPPAPAQPATAMPDVTPDVIAGRHSVREFAPASIGADRVATVLRDARTADLRALAPDATFDVAVAALRIEAQPRGVFLAGRDGLGRPCTARPRPEDLAATYADAAVLFLIFGAPGAGPHAYPALLNRAGAFGQTLWLAGRAAGLEGCVYGGSAPEVTAMVRATTGRPVRHLFTVSLGEPRR